jgi:hypothetical protein
MSTSFIDPRLWPRLHPLLIAHDVGGSRDRSTAVVGGYSGYAPEILGITEFNGLPSGLYGSDRANALARVDERFDRNALIVADLSNYSTYGEPLRGLTSASVDRCRRQCPLDHGSNLIAVVDSRSSLVQQTLAATDATSQARQQHPRSPRRPRILE